MKRTLILTTALLLAAPMAMAYQVTGPVLDVTDTKIVVEKGKEKWEMARDANTKVQGELKKGAKAPLTLRGTLAYAALPPRLADDPLAIAKAVRIRNGILHAVTDK